MRFLFRYRRAWLSKMALDVNGGGHVEFPVRFTLDFVSWYAEKRLFPLAPSAGGSVLFGVPLDDALVPEGNYSFLNGYLYSARPALCQ
jgi:hypothetical protein